MDLGGYEVSVRNILKAGGGVFGLSALLLLFLPATFLELLGLDTTTGLQWSMRMIGITVFALAGNMWQNAKQENLENLKRVGLVMSMAAMGLAILTLLIPTPLTWFAYLYATIGAAFSLAYLFALLGKKFR